MLGSLLEVDTLASVLHVINSPNHGYPHECCIRYPHPPHTNQIKNRFAVNLSKSRKKKCIQQAADKPQNLHYSIKCLVSLLLETLMISLKTVCLRCGTSEGMPRTFLFHLFHGLPKKKFQHPIRVNSRLLSCWRRRFGINCMLYLCVCFDFFVFFAFQPPKPCDFSFS